MRAHGEAFRSWRPAALAAMAVMLVLGVASPAFAAGAIKFRTPATSYPSGGSQPIGLASGDFNGDGHVDLVTANQNGVTVGVLLGAGDGTFGAPVTVSAGIQPTGLVAGDFTGDGDLDVATTNLGTNTVTILAGDGAGNLSVHYTIPPYAGSPWGIAAGYFDGDPSLDLAVGYLGSGLVGILLNTGTGQFTWNGAYGAVAPYDLVARDFNLDGACDLAVANSGGAIDLRLGNGLGNFPGSFQVGVSGQPFALASTDFDGDGDLDIATANMNQSTCSTIRNLGLPPFVQFVSVFPTSLSSPRGIVAGDYDEDGKEDLVLTNYGNNTATAFLGNGNGTYAYSAAFGTAGSGPWGAVSGDFNEDGDLDMATVCFNSNVVSIHLGDITPPTGSIVVDGDATYAIDTEVEVNNFVDGASEMRFDSGSGYSGWEPYASSAMVELPEGDGRRTVRAEFRDALDNRMIAEDSIVLDTVPPDGSMVVNEDDSYTNDPDVLVHSSVVGATQIQLKAGDVWGHWQTYWHTKPVTLPDGDGEQTVHARYCDPAGNVFECEDSIILDTTPPGIDWLASMVHTNPDIWYADDSPSIQWGGSDPSPGSGVVGYSWTLDHAADTMPDTVSEGAGTSENYTDLDDGEYYFHVRALDEAGNWGDPAHLRVRIDASPDLALAAAPTLLSYNGETTLTVEMSTNDGEIDGRDDVTVWHRAATGVAWSKVATATWDAGDGRYEAECACPENEVFQARFAGDATYDAATSNDVAVRVYPYLGRPWSSPSTPTHRRTAYIYGYLEPLHTGRTKLQIYRLVGSRYKLWANKYATNYAYGTPAFTRYKYTWKPPYAGKWRVRAYHSDASHAAMYSPWRYFRVR